MGAPQAMTRVGASVRVLAPGLTAWLLTVAQPAAQQGTGFGARFAAVAGAVALIVGGTFAWSERLLARVLALYLFVGFCVLAWSFQRAELAPDRIDRVRALAGSFAWLLFALGWGHTTPRPTPPPAEHAAGLLLPRARLPRASVLVAALAVLVSLTLVVLAFRVDRPEHALFAHTVAVASGLLLMATAGRMALARGQRLDAPSASARLDAASLPGAVLGALFAIGLVWAAFR